jgi:hypothetical protein
MPDTAFDPDFDDRDWTLDWMAVPVASVPAMAHPSGYRVVRRVVQETEIFGQPYRLTVPFDCRLLFDPEGRLWMSDTPQERIMMANNARRSHGHALVGGLGLGLYPQLAAALGQVERFTVIEHSPVVQALVEPVLAGVLDVPLDLRIGDVGAMLAGPVSDAYDTIFLDTWPALDATYLPAVNRLRELARDHLAPGGTILLWGYRWMVALFEEACRALLAVDPREREAWLAAHQGRSPAGVALLGPVLDHFSGLSIDDWDAALAWCRAYAIHLVAAA